MRPTLVLIGGFLGAGKTTLIVRAAEILRGEGLRVAAITNDQDAGLVDTQYTEARAIPTREVAGACFCCRFGDLMDAADRLRAYQPDVIFAEPVGSCVDLSATILQPLKAYYRAEYAIAPLTVLVDPAMAGRVREKGGDDPVAYLFHQQLSEADLVCLTKTDCHGAAISLPVAPDFALSAVSGAGIGEWLACVRGKSRAAGAKLLSVDYERYAEAEAALGWVNVQAVVKLSEPLSPASLAGPVMDIIESRLSQAGVEIAHLKIACRCETGFLKVSVCRNGGEPQPDGDLAASPAVEHELSINLRALGDPEGLLGSVRAALELLPGTVTISHTGAFRPSPPKPEHRFRAIVG